MIYFLILWVVIGILFGYAAYNQMIKIERLEDYITSREDEIQSAIDIMTTIDINGAFESDDEVGAVFTTLKNTVTELQKTYDQ